jgi:DNA-binding NarL/FixJ family response regulator
VLQLAAEGRTTREIAAVLVLSPGTVKTHFQHIYEKLHAADRVAAVATALRLGLIS